MAHETRVTCDACGKQTKGWEEKKNDYRELALDNWSASILSHWFEPVEDGTKLSEFKTEREVEFSLCRDCSKRVAQVMRDEVGRIKKAGKND